MRGTFFLAVCGRGVVVVCALGFWFGAGLVWLGLPVCRSAVFVCAALLCQLGTFRLVRVPFVAFVPSISILCPIWPLRLWLQLTLLCQCMFCEFVSSATVLPV